MWIEDGFLRRPPPKPDGRFSRIRLSSSWLLLMNWLRHSTHGFRRVLPAAQACAPLTWIPCGSLLDRHPFPGKVVPCIRAHSLSALHEPLRDGSPKPSNTTSLPPLAPRSLPASSLLRGR